MELDDWQIYSNRCCINLEDEKEILYKGEIRSYLDISPFWNL